MIEIHSYLKENYNIDVININLISSQNSDVYRIETKYKIYALIIYSKTKKSNELKNELDLNSFLNEFFNKKIKFQKQIKSKYLLDECLINDRYSILFEWVDFYTYNNNIKQKKNIVEFYFKLNSALNYAYLHLTLNFQIIGIMNNCLDCKSTNFVKINFYDFKNSSFYKKILDNIQGLNICVDYIYNYYEKNINIINSLELTFIHNDLTPNNIGFDKFDDVLFVMDFDLCRIGVLQYDLCWFFWSFCKIENKYLFPYLESEINNFLRTCRKNGYKIDMQMFLFMLIARLLLTLNGRLKNEVKGLSNSLTFVDEKLNDLIYISNNFSKHFSL